MDPQTGLVTYILKNFRGKREEAVPDIRKDKTAWYHHFDYDKYAATRPPHRVCTKT